MRLESVQLDAARVICGMLRSSPREAVLTECGLPELRSIAEMRWLLELDKCKRAGENHPRRVWGLVGVRNRLRRIGWRGMAASKCAEILPVGVWAACECGPLV